MSNLSTLIFRILPKFYPNFNCYLPKKRKFKTCINTGEREREREREMNMQYTKVKTCINTGEREREREMNMQYTKVTFFR